jgi:hypothetical protein
VKGLHADVESGVLAERIRSFGGIFLITTSVNSTLSANCVFNFHENNLFSHFTSTPAEILAFRSSQDKDSICLLDLFLFTHDLQKQMTLLVE